MLQILIKMSPILDKIFVVTVEGRKFGPLKKLPHQNINNVGISEQ